MKLNQTPIKVKMSSELKSEIRNKANKLGLTMAAYMRYLAIKDVTQGELETTPFVIRNLDELSKEINKIRIKANFGRTVRHY